MSDAPMSRRARRTFEEEAAERAVAQDPTVAFAQGLASGEIAGVNSDGVLLSRRDRRRMDRLANPLEAWTAEEEMLATGQIPTMTPERIAEQERISREKAEAAAREAASASQEFRRLAQSEVWRAPDLGSPSAASHPSVNFPSVGVPSVGVPVVSEPGLVTSEPTWSDSQEQVPSAQNEWGVPHAELPHAELPHAEVQNAEPPHAEVPDDDLDDDEVTEVLSHADRYQPRMVFDEAPLAFVHPVEAHPVEAHAVHDAPAEHASDETSVASQQAIVDALFPPGSIQSKLREQDPFATPRIDEAPAAASGQIPAVLPQHEAPPRVVNAVEEMRRLAADAMSGIERASRADEAAAAAAAAAAVAAAAQAPEPTVAHGFDSLPSAQPSTTQPSRPAEAFGAPQAQQGAAFGGELPAAQWGTVREGSPSAAPQGAPASGQFPAQSQQGLQAPQGPAWSEHPLNTAPVGVVDPNNFTPLANAPKPDFSGLYQQQTTPTGFAPVTGAINTSSFGPGGFNASGLNAPGFNTTDPSATGQMSVIRRPDLPEVGGAKHFKWVHLAVIGALMFVLGVVIYNAAFAQ